MEPSVQNLERSVLKADSHLDDIAWKLDLFDREIAQLVKTENKQVSVMDLLESVIQVKEDYDKLKREIIEVQGLEKVVRDSLRFKTMEAQQTISIIREKLNKHHRKCK